VLQVLPVSAVVPHHNRSALVAAAVESIRRQTIPPAEIIVVDDGSSPEHREALGKLGEGVRVVYHEKPRGPSAARNTGIDLARQPWIAFLDDDDEWLPGKPERQWDILSADPSLDAVGCAVTVVSDHRPPWNLISHSAPIMTLNCALEDSPAFLQTLLIKTSVIRSLNGFDAENSPMLEDKEFWIRFTAAGYRAYYEQEPLAILNRKRIPRLTLSWWTHLSSHFRILSKHKALYEETYGRDAISSARSKGICRVGLERGAILGRLIYAAGCLSGGGRKALAKAADHGQDGDYSLRQHPGFRAE